jgi:hypothetical protein
MGYDSTKTGYLPPEFYVSTDIETDGPIPSLYSMLSFGSAVFTPKGEMVDTFTANLQTLPEATTHPDTMAWWAQSRNQAAYAATRVKPENPKVVMDNYVKWLNQYKPCVFVGYPAGFDFTFMYWYLIAFTGQSPFSFSALDMKSYAMAKLGTTYKNTVKRNFPSVWNKVEGKHSHIALDDAIEQGQIFMNMLNKDLP